MTTLELPREEAGCIVGSGGGGDGTRSKGEQMAREDWSTQRWELLWEGAVTGSIRRYGKWGVHCHPAPTQVMIILTLINFDLIILS